MERGILNLDKGVKRELQWGMGKLKSASINTAGSDFLRNRYLAVCAVQCSSTHQCLSVCLFLHAPILVFGRWLLLPDDTVCTVLHLHETQLAL